MAIIFGTLHIPIKHMHKQCIVNKVLFLGLPIAPLATFYAEKRDGQRIEGFRIKATIIPFLWAWLFLLGLLGFVAGVFCFIEENSLLGTVVLVLSAGVLTGGIFLQRNSKREKYVREQFYRSLNLAVMPEWLLEETFHQLFFSLQEEYIGRCQLPDWRIQLERLRSSEDIFPLTFCLTYMENIIRGEDASNRFLVAKYYK